MLHAKFNKSIIYYTCNYNYFYNNRVISGNLETTVRAVISNASGMGKSLHIKRYSEVLKKEYINDETEINPHYVCIPIHGPDISVTILIEQLQQCRQDPNNPYPQIIHFNIANSV